MKILFCTDGIFPHMVGGMQRHSKLLVEALARYEGLSITVLHPHPGIRVFEGCENVEEIALSPLPGKKPYLWELYDYSVEVHRIAMDHPDHLIYSQGLCVWAGIQDLAHRTIVNPHGLEPYQTLDFKTRLKTWPFRLVFDRIFRRAAFTVSLGGRLTDILKSRLPGKEGKIEVLPNAANPVELPEGFVKVRNETTHFLFAGRFAYNKGIDTLLTAVELIRQMGRDGQFKVSLVGKGPLFEQMKARFAFPEVEYMGFVPDEGLNELYNQADVLLLPTLFEGMPTVVLEAMAHGMPIVVTDVGATTELVDGQNGIVFAKQNPGSLADAMLHMMDCPAEEFQKMSGNSLVKFQSRFTWQAVALQHIHLFEKLKARLQQS